MKKILFLLFIFIAFFVISFSFFPWTHSLYLNGYSPSATTVLYNGVNSDDQNYKIVTDEDGKLSMFIRKYGLFWGKEFEAAEGTDGRKLISWIDIGSSRWYNQEKSLETETVLHLVVAGNDAGKLITFPTNVLPEGMTVSIYQEGSYYALHFMSYSFVAEPYELNIDKILKSLLD